jgi:hypothetical protein
MGNSLDERWWSADRRYSSLSGTLTPLLAMMEIRARGASATDERLYIVNSWNPRRSLLAVDHFVVCVAKFRDRVGDTCLVFCLHSDGNTDGA